MSTHNIKTEYNNIIDRIAKACHDAGRDPQTVAMLAVSKMQTVEAIRGAYACGIRDFGENYVQEMVDKQTALADLPDIRWHFIGHLQRNKAKQIQNCFALHSVDSLDIAKKLAESRAPESKPLNVYLQLEVDALDKNKFGLADAEAKAVCLFLANQTALRWVGFMGIGPLSVESEQLLLLYKNFVSRGTELWNSYGPKNSTSATPLFSLGMSGDLEHAIRAGSHLVRIGSALFGERASVQR